MLLSLPLELLEEILFRTGSAAYLRGARAACVQLFNMSDQVTARHFSLPTLDDFDIIAKVPSWIVHSRAIEGIRLMNGRSSVPSLTCTVR